MRELIVHEMDITGCNGRFCEVRVIEQTGFKVLVVYYVEKSITFSCDIFQLWFWPVEVT